MSFLHTLGSWRPSLTQGANPHIPRAAIPAQVTLWRGSFLGRDIPKSPGHPQSCPLHPVMPPGIPQPHRAALNSAVATRGCVSCLPGAALALEGVRAEVPSALPRARAGRAGFVCANPSLSCPVVPPAEGERRELDWTPCPNSCRHHLQHQANPTRVPFTLHLLISISQEAALGMPGEAEFPAGASRSQARSRSFPSGWGDTAAPSPCSQRGASGARRA